MNRLAEFIAAHPRLLVLSGAGLSTASGIGDYRDRQGRYKRPPPVTIGEFVASAAARQRYWARSMFGWPAFAGARPNAGHRALAELQAAGYLRGGLITQNVDGLHQGAGHTDVIALHGELAQVVCMDCGLRLARHDMQQHLLGANAFLLGATAELLPDGDAELNAQDLSRFQTPPCPACGGMLKPDVVFFGDAVPKERVQACYARVDAADALLIVGSSVMVFSSYRFCRRAQERGLPIVALNIGKTRVDDCLAFKLEAACAPELEAVARLLT